MLVVEVLLVVGIVPRLSVSVVDILIDSAFAKDDIGGDDTADEAFEAVMTLELAEFDEEELFETEIAVVAWIIGGGVVMTRG